MRRPRHRSAPPANAYVTSKSALEARPLNLAAELVDSGVTVNVFRPGSVHTDMFAYLRGHPANVGTQKCTSGRSTPITTVSYSPPSTQPDLSLRIWIPMPAGRSGMCRPSCSSPPKAPSHVPCWRVMPRCGHGYLPAVSRSHRAPGPA